MQCIILQMLNGTKFSLFFNYFMPAMLLFDTAECPKQKEGLILRFKKGKKKG